MTIVVVDCASLSTVLAGAGVWFGSEFLGSTDASGQFMVMDASDQWEWVTLTIRKPGAGTPFDPGYIDKNVVIDRDQSGTTQAVCLNQAPPVGCVTAETRITLPDGTEKSIAALRVGDGLLGRSGRRNRVTAIMHTHLGSRRLFALNGSDPFVTAEHPFLTEAGWKAIAPDATAPAATGLDLGRLEVNDVVFRLSRSAVAVGASSARATATANEVFLPTVVEQLDACHAPAKTELYNLVVDGDHTYIANGFIVHNKSQTLPDCFVVTAATESSASVEVRHLRQLRDRLSATSRLAGRLIDEIYREYAEFSPAIAAHLRQDATTRAEVLRLVVRPLFAWYTLAAKLALDAPDAAAIGQAVQQIANVCPRDWPAAPVVALLRAIRSGEALPAGTPSLPRQLAARVAHCPFASWAMLDSLIRVWTVMSEDLEPVGQVAQWLASAPIERLPPSSDPQSRDHEIETLADLFAFQPAARVQVGRRLLTAWPDAASALTRAGFLASDQQVV